MRRHLRHDLLRRMSMNPCQRGEDGIGQRLRFLRVGLHPGGGAVERSAGIVAAEHRERILPGARIAEDAQILVFALKNGDRRVQHHRRLDLPLLHGGDGGRPEADADHGHAGRIDVVLLQEILEEEIRRRSGRADADLLAGQILDRPDRRGVLRRHHQHQSGIAVIDHESLHRLLPGGEIDAVVEVAGDHVGAAAEHRLQRIGATLEVDQIDIEPGLLVRAQLRGEHRGQIAQARTAADGDRNPALRRCRMNHQRQRQQRRDQSGKQPAHGFLHATVNPHHRAAPIS